MNGQDYNEILDIICRAPTASVSTEDKKEPNSQKDEIVRGKIRALAHYSETLSSIISDSTVQSVFLKLLSERINKNPALPTEIDKCLNELKSKLSEFEKSQSETISRFFSLCKEEIKKYSVVPDSPSPPEKSDSELQRQSDINDFFNKIEAKADEVDKKVEAAEKAATDAKEAAESAKNQVNTATEAAEDAKETAKNVMPNVLTTIGIFIAIIIAVVACYLNIILTDETRESISTLASYRIPLVFMLYLLMGHIMLSVIFFLMYLISKMTAFRLSCNCNAYFPLKKDEKKPYESIDCKMCKYFYSCDSENAAKSGWSKNGSTNWKTGKTCSPLKIFRKRYPYFIAYNAVFVVLYLILFIWFVVSKCTCLQDSVQPLICVFLIMILILLVVLALRSEPE